MRVLDRYVLTECLPTLGLSLAVLTFVLLMHRLFMLSDLVVVRGVPVWEVGRLLLLALPSLMPLLLPVSLLLAVVLAMGRLSADSEVVVLRACGVGLAQNLRPVFILSAAVTLVAVAISLWAQPWAARSFKSVLYDSFRNRIGAATETGVFTPVARGITVYAGGLDRDTGTLRDLFLAIDQGAGEAGALWILAREGHMEAAGGALRLDLTDGEMHQHNAPGQPYRRLRFERYQVSVPVPMSNWSPGVEDQATGTLLTLAGSGDRDARLELHRRFAVPTTCLVLGLLGGALGLHHHRAGRSRGVTLSLGVLFLYYALFTAGRTLGRQQGIPPAVAMWTPNLVLGLLAVYAFRCKNREDPLPFEEAASRWLVALKARFRRGAGVS